jgi:hypothetical protein
MGIYLNPSNEMFGRALRSEIYVDKSELIAYANAKINTEQEYLCVSRPGVSASPLQPICLQLIIAKDMTLARCLVR